MNKIKFRQYLIAFLIIVINFDVPQASNNKADLLRLRKHAREGTCPNPAPKSWSLMTDCNKKSCGNIKTCEEAYYYLLVCGHQVRDGSNRPHKSEPDGVPCEKKCRRIDSDLKRVPTTSNLCAVH